MREIFIWCCTTLKGLPRLKYAVCSFELRLSEDAGTDCKAVPTTGMSTNFLTYD